MPIRHHLHTMRSRESWDVSTLLMTGVAAGLIVLVIAAVLHSSPVATVLLSAGAAVLVGGLAGYRPLHELDTEQVEQRFGRRDRTA